jgi:hypothetical protein
VATKSSKSERAIAGAGYIISFFSDIEVLILNASNYVNNIARLKFRLGDITPKTELGEGDKAIIGVIEVAKTSVFSTYVKFNALKNKIKEFKMLDGEKKKKKGERQPTIESLYEKIREAPIPEVEDVENYVILLNRLFVEAIDILTAAQGVYADAVSPLGESDE